MLLKNFGVTRHGRVVFYDYDEICLLTECNFRTMPEPRTEDEVMAAEPWFHVGPHDIFPSEFRSFMGLYGPLLDVFLAAHGDLLGTEFWREMQALHAAGEVMDIFPYRPERRLREGRSDPSRVEPMSVGAVGCLRMARVRMFQRPVPGATVKGGPP